MPKASPAETLLTFRSLRSRALVLLLGTVAAVALLAWLVFSPLFARTFEAEAKKRGEGLARILEKHQDVRLALSLKDERGASKVASEVKAGDNDIVSVLLVDANRKVIGRAGVEASADEQMVSAHLDQVAVNDGVDRFTQEVRSEAGGGASDLDFAADDAPADPKKKGSLGWVLVGISTGASRAQLTTQTLSIILLTALGLLVVFFIFFRGVEVRLKQVTTFAERIASGELDAELEPQSPDEIGSVGSALIDMSSKTGAMVARMQAASAALVKASADVLQSSRLQSEKASQQAASVTETGATVTELRQTFQQATDRAQSVIDLAKRSEDATTSGRRSVEQSVQAMQQLSEHVVQISRAITGLVERTAQIASIIDTVNDLAEQSNVLALNAAIESAKAGEHGRGFSVVAREVRSLAERSKDSTTQVRQMLLDVERASREALTVIEEGNRKARASMELSERAGESITTLDQAIGESSTAAKQIAASTRQQGVGVEQIWQAMRDIDRTVKESATGIRQLEDASTNINALADQMGQLVARYRVSAKS